MSGSRFAAGAAERSQPERNLHILLADGDKNARHTISRLLHDRGHAVTEVSDGNVAMELLSSQHIGGTKVDVVFADVQTAGVNGPDFLRKFSAKKYLRLTPVVVMSSEESSRDLVIQCLDAGACECLSKPVRHNDMATVLEHVRQRMSGSSGKAGILGEGVGTVGSLSSGEAAGNSGSNKDPASGGAMEGANGRAGSRGERSGSGEEDGGRPNRGSRPGSGGDASGAGSGAGGGSGGGSGSNGSGGGTDGSGSNGRGEEQSSAGSRSLRPPAALHLPVGGPSSNYHSSEGASDTSSRAHFANNLKGKGVLDPPPFANLASTTPPAAAEKQGSEGEEDEIGGSGGEGSPDTDEQEREDVQRDEDEAMEEQGEINEREPQRSQMPSGGNRILPRGLLELAHLGNCREQEAHALAIQQQKSYHAVVEDEAAARHQKMMVTQNATSRSSLKHSNSCSAFSAFGVPGDMEEASYYNRFPHELPGHPHGPHVRPLHPGSHPYGHPRPPHMDGHQSHYGHHPVHQAPPPPHYAHHPSPFPYPMMHPMMHGWVGMSMAGMPRMPPGIRASSMSSHMSNYYNQAAMQQMGNALRNGPPPHGHSHPSTPTMAAASANYASPGQHPQLSSSPSASGASGAEQPKPNVQQGQLSVHGFPNSHVRRQAALAKFREKRKNRNFDRKVRYESRKRLAEERPRIRGQFVKRSELSTTDGGSNSSNTASNTAVGMGSSRSPPAVEEATATV